MADKIKHKYSVHKAHAKERGVEFTLTYAEWLEVWGEKINQRGRGPDQFGMLRHRDEGGYTPGNVYIGTPKQNRQEKVVGDMVKSAQGHKTPSAYRPKPPNEGAWLLRRDVFKESCENDEENS